jgi:hypothetical protein
MIVDDDDVEEDDYDDGDVDGEAAGRIRTHYAEPQG